MRLKEDAREWRKFGLSSALVLALATGFLCWRGVLAIPWVTGALACCLFGAVLALVRPRLMRTPYRLGMRLSQVLGRVVAPVILSVVFLLLLTPLGLVLRLTGQDLLGRRRDPRKASYWQPPTGSDDLTKMF